MKRAVLLVLALAFVFAVAATGCESFERRYGPDIRYRKIVHQRVVDADVVGFADDTDAVFLNEQPTHLSPWYNQ